MDLKVLIFVVEDEALIQSLIEDILTDAGFAVTSASHAEDAMKVLDEKGTEFRALVTDVNLGTSKITGWDIARRAREINDQIPVIYITSVDAHEWSVHGVPSSILLTKPFADAQLVTAVAQLLNTGSTPSV